MGWLQRLFFAFVLVLVLAIGFVGYTFWSAGQFKTITPQFAGVCKTMDNVPGAEDITIHPDGTVAYISSDDRRATRDGKSVPGAIYRYDLRGAAPILKNLTPQAGDDFHPHGISLYVDDAGRSSLFVVNHFEGWENPNSGDAPEHSIEIFDIEGTELVHRKSIKGALLVSPNDIVALDHERFYVTNDHHFAAGLMRKVEDYLQLALSNVLYYGGQDLRVVADEIAYANGIAYSKTDKRLYVAAVTGKKMLSYDIDAKTGDLELENELFLNAGIDNLELDAKGNIWIGAHPQMLSFVGHAADETKLSPSLVLKLVRAPSGGFQAEEVYLDAGDQISGSSVAARHGNRLLIGAVFEPHFLDCSL